MSGLTVARKVHTCAFCGQRIEKGQAHVAWVILPSQHPDADVPWRGHGHELCNAFWCERLGQVGDLDEIPIGWDEAKRVFDWDGWLVSREAVAGRGDTP